MVKIVYDLPEGEYQFLAGYQDPRNDKYVVASNLVSFDVAGDRKATFLANP